MRSNEIKTVVYGTPSKLGTAELSQSCTCVYTCNVVTSLSQKLSQNGCLRAMVHTADSHVDDELVPTSQMEPNSDAPSKEQCNVA